MPGPVRTVGVAIAGLVLLGACAPAPGPAPADPQPASPQPAKPQPAKPLPIDTMPIDPPQVVPRPGEPAPRDTASDLAGECPQSGVRITSPGSSAAMGLRALGLLLVNCGTKPYRLNGHPVPRLYDGDGDPIPVRVVDGAREITSGFDAPPRPVTLRPGERAAATVLWRNLVTDSTVVATNGERLEIAPAEGRPAQMVGLDGPIDLGNTGRIGVSAWKKQTDPAP